MYTLVLPVPDITNGEFSVRNQNDNIEKGRINDAMMPAVPDDSRGMQTAIFRVNINNNFDPLIGFIVDHPLIIWRSLKFQVPKSRESFT